MRRHSKYDKRDERGFEARFPPHQFFHGIEIYAVLHELGGEGMPKVMKAHILESGLVANHIEGLPEVARTNALALDVEEYVVADEMSDPGRFLENVQGLAADWQHIWPAAFLFKDGSRLAKMVHMGPLEAWDLTLSQSGFSSVANMAKED